MQDVPISVSDFVGLLNQTLEFAYPSVLIVGELANFRISKNRWVYFDLKDEYSSVKFFGTVHQLPGPLEDGMMLQVRGVPRLHHQFGFSVNVQFLQPVGEGSLRKAAELLQAQLAAEGLFDPERKRILPYPPTRIGLIASGESAAYHDFMKILNQRWSGVEIVHADVQVQGEQAPAQIMTAIEYLNTHAEAVDVLVITRGGGSADDLAAFSTEQVTRAVAASRVPTLVAIGHEVDVSLAELAADQRASTPSNAAELLVPDKREVQRHLAAAELQLRQLLSTRTTELRHGLDVKTKQLHDLLGQLMQQVRQQLTTKQQLLRALNPQTPLKRGYALIHKNGVLVKSRQELNQGDTVSLKFHDGQAEANVTSIE